jgi:hypothetical protein
MLDLLAREVAVVTCHILKGKIISSWPNTQAICSAIQSVSLTAHRVGTVTESRSLMDDGNVVPKAMNLTSH